MKRLSLKYALVLIAIIFGRQSPVLAQVVAYGGPAAPEPMASPTGFPIGRGYGGPAVSLPPWGRFEDVGPLPDLVPVIVRVATNCRGTISLWARIENRGTAPAPASTAVLFVNARERYNSRWGRQGHEPIASAAVPAIKAGSAAPATFSIVRPRKPEWVSRRLELTVKADAASSAPLPAPGMIKELDEANNRATTTIAYGPDIDVVSLTERSTKAAPDTFTLTARLVNRGTISTGVLGSYKVRWVRRLAPLATWRDFRWVRQEVLLEETVANHSTLYGHRKQRRSLVYKLRPEDQVARLHISIEVVPEFPELDSRMNNQQTWTKVLPPPGPDIVSMGIIAPPWDNQVVKLAGFLANQGATAVPATTAKFSIVRPTDFAGPIADVSAPAMAALASTLITTMTPQVNWRVSSELKGQWVMVRMEADSARAVTEYGDASDGSNGRSNFIDRFIYIPGRTARPDFMPYVNAPELTNNGRTLVFTGQITNTGDRRGEYRAVFEIEGAAGWTKVPAVVQSRGARSLLPNDIDNVRAEYQLSDTDSLRGRVKYSLRVDGHRSTLPKEHVFSPKATLQFQFNQLYYSAPTFQTEGYIHACAILRNAGDEKTPPFRFSLRLKDARGNTWEAFPFELQQQPIPPRAERNLSISFALKDPTIFGKVISGTVCLLLGDTSAPLLTIEGPSGDIQLPLRPVFRY